MTGVFLDPPYGEDAGRDAVLYSRESLTVAADVRAWCLENGNNKQLRIALCGYQGEHDMLEQHGWSVLSWKAKGGYGNQNQQGNVNATRERIWFSPHCRTRKGNVKVKVIEDGNTSSLSNPGRRGPAGRGAGRQLS
jgi:hypothetical protein